MSLPQDQLKHPTSNDNVTQGFFAALVGSLLGNITGDVSGSLAKLFLYFRKGDEYPLWQLTEISLVVILLFTFIFIIFGVYSTKRGWAKEEQIVLSVVSAFFVALATMIDQSLPGPNGAIFGEISEPLFLNTLKNYSLNLDPEYSRLKSKANRSIDALSSNEYDIDGKILEVYIDSLHLGPKHIHLVGIARGLITIELQS